MLFALNDFALHTLNFPQINLFSSLGGQSMHLGIRQTFIEHLLCVGQMDVEAK